jgi:hypothetical protein
MTDSHHTLSKQIEQLVHEHIAASRRAAAEAVERAFSAAGPARPRTATARTEARTGGRRRGPAEMAALAEQLYEAVCAQPGETAGVLGPVLGKPARELHRPMTVLKRAGRVRSVGQRHQTRYYPSAPRSAG